MCSKFNNLLATLMLMLPLLSLNVLATTAANNLEITTTTTPYTTVVSEQPTVPQCSDYFRDIVAGIYIDNFANFKQVLQFASYSNSSSFKAEIMIALYYHMLSINHLRNPLYAIPLYNEVEPLLNSSLEASQLSHLYNIAFALFWSNIVPKSVEILEAAVYLNTCNHENTTVGHLLDLLHVSNETLTTQIFRSMVFNVHEVLPAEELLQIFGNFSLYVSQNIEAMLELYNLNGIKKDLQMDFFLQLAQLQEHRDYNATVSLGQKQRIEYIMPKNLQNLFSGEVCIYQHLANGSRIYVQECKPTFLACVYIYPAPIYMTAFKVHFNATIKGFTFISGYYADRALLIRPEAQEQTGGYKLNVWSPRPPYVDDTNWKVTLADDRVILQNMNSTMYLCAGNERTRQNADWNAYTRNATSFALYPDECQWYMDNCKGLSN